MKQNREPFRLWALWIATVLITPLPLCWRIPEEGLDAVEGLSEKSLWIAFGVILTASLVVMSRKTDARWGTGEWIVETLLRGVLLSFLGVIIAGTCAFAGCAAATFSRL